MIWGNLLHLSMNMWCDWDAPELKGDDVIYRPDLRFDRSLWDDLLKKMQQAGHEHGGDRSGRRGEV